MKSYAAELEKYIARPIPMKRELKDLLARNIRAQGDIDRKAHPDEKGTERCRRHLQARPEQNRKAHPDEKGTERLFNKRVGKSRKQNRKAHPDEKGTERTIMYNLMEINIISQGL